jgi:hypothetical protein
MRIIRIPVFSHQEPLVTFDATTPGGTASDLRLDRCDRLTVCDLSGVERFLVWSVRWCTSLHEDPAFADACLQDSFDRAGLSTCLPSFRRYVAMAHGAPTPCPPSARLGCWRINTLEARTLHALACLQADRFGDAWRALTPICTRTEAARAMLALGEIADALSGLKARVRAWDPPQATDLD